jgi:hypothetical protein
MRLLRFDLQSVQRGEALKRAYLRFMSYFQRK